MTQTATPTRPCVNESLLLALARQRQAGFRHWQIAARADAHPSQLSQWLNGHKQPTPAQAERLAAVLRMPVEVLFPSVDDLTRNGASAANADPAKTDDPGDGRDEL